MDCPACGHTEAVEQGDTLLWCSKCGGTFPVPNGIAQHQHTGWGPTPTVELVNADVQCARCGSSCGWEPTEDEDQVFYFCLSKPEWCEANPREGREGVQRGTPEFFEVYSDGSVVIVGEGA